MTSVYSVIVESRGITPSLNRNKHRTHDVINNRKECYIDMF